MSILQIRMNVEDIHPEIRKFVKDCSEMNFRIHQRGTAASFSFKNPKITIIFGFDENKEQIIRRIVLYEGEEYNEEEFLRLLRLKVFW